MPFLVMLILFLINEPMICCPTRKDSFDFTNHHSKSMKDRWIWERRPQINNKKSDRFDMEDKFIKNDNQLISMNLINDYIDWKTHRNCPPVLFKETKDNLYRNVQGHHQRDNDHTHSIYHFEQNSPDRFELNEQRDYHDHLHDHFNDEYYDSNEENKHSYWSVEFLKPQKSLSHDKSKTLVTTTVTAATVQKKNTSKNRPTSSLIVNSPNCGLKLENRIIGGIEAVPGEFPWITRIAYLNQTDKSIAYRCTGSFISQLHILTAAHCVANLDTSLSLSHVRLVDSNINANNDCSNQNQSCEGNLRNFEIEGTIVHPNYDNPKRANDIAIIKIKRLFNQKANYGTVCLPNSNESNFLNGSLIGSTGIVAGWSNFGGADKNDLRVRYLRLEIINNTKCAERYDRFREGFIEKIIIVPSMVCTQGQSNGSDVCRGDSGGPLMDDAMSKRDSRYTLIGIVAFGPTCGFTNLLPGVYMRISEYVDWITSNIT